MKVTVYYTSEPDSANTTAYLDDEPLVGGHHAGVTKHSDQDLRARWEPARDRWEITWIQPFAAKDFL